MLDTDTKRRIDTARDILVGKVPDPKSQVEQITIALIYKFMDDMDAESEEFGGKRKFFEGEFARYGWAKRYSIRDNGKDYYGSLSRSRNWIECSTTIWEEVFRVALIARARANIDLRVIRLAEEGIEAAGFTADVRDPASLNTDIVFNLCD